jgi:hypothetical protein
MAVYNKDEGKQDGYGTEIEAAVMTVDVDSSGLFRFQMQRLTMFALVSLFRRFARVDAQPRITPILILGGNYDSNNSTCFIRH